MRVSFDAEHSSNTLGQTSESAGITGRRDMRVVIQRSGLRGSLRVGTVVSALLCLFVAETLSATTAIDALEKMRVGDLKQILERRGISCDG